jgi:hypothetical protein
MLTNEGELMAMDHWTPWLWFADANAGYRDISGYLASGLVLATFAMKSMRPLRLVAICSNAAFIYYASEAHIIPVMILHCILLPLNVFRLAQLQTNNLRDWVPSGQFAGRRVRWLGSSARRREVFAILLSALSAVVIATALSTLRDRQTDALARTISWPPGFL